MAARLSLMAWTAVVVCWIHSLSRFHGCCAFLPSTFHARSRRSAMPRGVVSEGVQKDPNRQLPAACVVGHSENDESTNELLDALHCAGFRTALAEDDAVTAMPLYRYAYSKATGMLKLMSTPLHEMPSSFDAPRWVSVVRGEENVLVANGWSFLDSDDSEPNSAFDIDAANEEGLYRPKWGKSEENGMKSRDTSTGPLSNLGFSLRHMSSEEIVSQANGLKSLSRSVLLEGGTDPPKLKCTNNDYDFSGSAGQSDIDQGIFVCAVGGLPLFSSVDLSPLTASSGWLSFARPISEDHVVLVKPDKDSFDQRIEVVCAKSRCHLGLYFGKGDGYCINASALNFVPKEKQNYETNTIDSPVSWRSLEAAKDSSLSSKLLYEVLKNTVSTETLVLGAGCFWHVEFALRRLPGIISTEVGYAGGTTTSPSYDDVCHKNTGHAEVVKVTFDPKILSPRILMDCFLTLHDPTKVRALGKHAQGTGQYRSCIFVTNDELEREAIHALEECRAQLQKDLSTDVRKMITPSQDTSGWFWRAEDRHQRHDERRTPSKEVDTATLPVTEWLSEYGRRSQSVSGSSQTIKISVDDQASQTMHGSVDDQAHDDGMAMMMI